MKKLNQMVSVTISAALAVTAAPWPSSAAPSAGPAFLQTLTPPTRMGFVDSYFQGTNAKPVILIQDLHANLGVQKKIMSMLKFLQPNISDSGKMIIGMENAWRNYDLSYVRSKPLPVRTKAMNILLKEAIITGPEYFATLSPKDVQLIGVDNEQDKKLHLDLTRESFQSRMALSGKIDTIQAQIQELKANAPHRLAMLWRAEADYQKGKIGLDVLSHVMGQDVVLTNGKQAEEQLMNHKLELAEKDGGKNATLLKNVVVADQSFNTLSRLLRQQMTLEEVQFATQNADKLLNVVKAFLPNEDLTQWKEAVNTAIDYYAVALVRDTPLAENTADLVSKNPDTSIIIVTGGFHTAGIAKMLQQRNISHMIISPIVESHTSRDEMLYIRRILGEPLSSNDLAHDLQTASSAVAYNLQPTGLEMPVAEQQKGDVGAALGSVEQGQVTPPTPADEAPSNPDSQRKLMPVFTSVRDYTGRSLVALTGDIFQMIRNAAIGSVYLFTVDQKNFFMHERSPFQGVLDKTTKQFFSERSDYKGNFYLVPSVEEPGKLAFLPDNKMIHQIHVSRNAYHRAQVTITDALGNLFTKNNDGWYPEGPVKAQALTVKVIKVIDQAMAAMGHGSLQDYMDKHGITDIDFEFAPNNALEETFFNDLGNGRVRVRLSPNLITNTNPNAMFVAVAKALVNIETPEQDENVTLPRFFEIAARAIGLEALQEAYRAFGLGGAPFVEAVQELILFTRSATGSSSDNKVQAARIRLAVDYPAESQNKIKDIVNRLLDNPMVKRVLYTDMNGNKTAKMRKLMPVVMADGAEWSSQWRDASNNLAKLVGARAKQFAEAHEAQVAALSSRLKALLATNADPREVQRLKDQIEAKKRGFLAAA